MFSEGYLLESMKLWTLFYEALDVEQCFSSEVLCVCRVFPFLSFRDLQAPFLNSELALGAGCGGRWGRGCKEDQEELVTSLLGVNKEKSIAITTELWYLYDCFAGLVSTVNWSWLLMNISKKKSLVQKLLHILYAFDLQVHNDLESLPADSTKLFFSTASRPFYYEPLMCVWQSRPQTTTTHTHTHTTTHTQLSDLTRPSNTRKQFLWKCRNVTRNK